MTAIYLQGADLAAYGVPNATPQQLIMASEIINGYCNKPAGMLYSVNNGIYTMDETGAPISESGTSSPDGRMILSYQPVVLIVNTTYNRTPGGFPNFVNFLGSYATPNGAIWFPASIPGSSLMHVDYIAGWTYTNLPAAIKLACASIVNFNDTSNEEIQILSGPLVSRRSGDTEEKFASATANVTSKESGYGFYINNAIVNMLASYRRVMA